MKKRSRTSRMKKTSSLSPTSNESSKEKTLSGTTKTKNGATTTPLPIRLLPLDLASPRTSAEWLEEPSLLFAQNKRHIDPKTGIMLYGPRSLATARHKKEVHVGFIG